MMLALLFLACAQAADLETLIGRLAAEDPAEREKAVGELAALGPQVVPRILSLHRSTDSAETKLRAEAVLLRLPFSAYVRTRPDEPLRGKLRDAILTGLETHRQPPGCLREEQERVSIDPKVLSVMRQGGSGHGNTLELDEISPRKLGGLTIRRLAYEAPTPYRPKVLEEKTRVEEVVLDSEEARALGELLETAVTLRPFCSKEPEPGRSRWSSASFSLRFRVESAGKLVWKCSYTGYPQSSKENQYIHGQVVDQVLRAALAHRTWQAFTITAEDRRRLLRWTEENFEREEWWVRERYLRMAVTAGDESFLPFLRQAAKDLRGKEGPSEVRQQADVKEALQRIAGSDD